MNYKEYKDIFVNYMKEGQPIFNKAGEELQLHEGEEFRQCYDPEIPVRRDLPTSWFVSNRGSVVSVYGKEPLWLMQDINEQGRGSYHFWLNGKCKSIRTYTLVGLVFGAERFGRADELLQQKSVYAFGNNGSRDNLQAHHMMSKESHPELLNDPENVEFVTARVHNLINSAPDPNATKAEQKEFMKKMAQICDREAPGKPVIFLPGYKKNKDSGTWEKTSECSIYEVDVMRFTKNGIVQLDKIAEALRKKMKEDSRKDENVEETV